MALRRMRVRGMSKDYNDPGPDLLRTKENACHQVGNLFGKAADGYFLRRNPPGEREDWSAWSKDPMRRAQVLDKVEAFCKGSPDKSKLQIGRKASGKVEAKQEVLIAVVNQVALPSVNAGARLVADLFREQWSGDTGGFNCREYNNVPGSGWSDHAWGDAVDLDINAGSPGGNDRITDWCVRMAKEGLMGGPAQFIGSRNGNVGSFIEPTYAWRAGGPVSHLTHVHCSFQQHYGRDPNCR